MLQQSKETRKKKLLDINYKCIDYDDDIVQKILRNTKDLSRKNRIQAKISQSKIDFPLNQVETQKDSLK